MVDLNLQDLIQPIALLISATFVGMEVASDRDDGEFLFHSGAVSLALFSLSGALILLAIVEFSVCEIPYTSDGFSRQCIDTLNYIGITYEKLILSVLVLGFLFLFSSGTKIIGTILFLGIGSRYSIPEIKVIGSLRDVISRLESASNWLRKSTSNWLRRLNKKESKMAEYKSTPPPICLTDGIQLRIAFSDNDGEITRFLVQLEYWLDNKWGTVARYDHDRDAHDITEEGLHKEIYYNGEVETTDLTNPISATKGFSYAKDDLQRNAEQYIRRFRDSEQGHENGGRRGPMNDIDYNQMPDRIEETFDHVYELIAEEFDGDREDYEPENLNQWLDE